MIQSTPEAIWNLEGKDFLDFLESSSVRLRHRDIHFYAPGFTYYKTKYYCSSPNSFPTISVTGTSCTLKCKHCGGKVLETMHSALSPLELFDLCAKLKKNGAHGCLISGGCLSNGSVPLTGFIDVLNKIKNNLGLTVFVHTGIISLETATSLKKAGVDAALIDIIGSDETIAKVYNLKCSLRAYAESLKALNKSELPFVPHVIVGLNEGRLDGELEALKMISQVKPSAIVVIAFMPIRETDMAKTHPPIPTDIAKVVALARFMFPETPLLLGCMRPKGTSRGVTDVLALKAGVDGIAFPSEEGIKYAEKKGFGVSFSSYCCAQIYMDAIEKTEH